MEMRKIKLILLLAALTTIVMLAGCGSENRSGESGVTGSGYNTVGLFVCFNCHADSKNPASFETVFGDSQANPVDGWVSGPHGNGNNLPSYTTFGTDESCKVCHDPLGEGMNIQDFYLKTGITSLGTANRPVIGCESCHGGGGAHYGIGPVAIAKPGVQECGKCHNATFPASHAPYHPEGDNILENYTASGHSTSIKSFHYVTGTNEVKARCSRCHSDEGMRMFSRVINGTESKTTLTNTLNLMANVPGASPIQCKTCHDGHNPKKLIGDKIAGLPASWGSEFKTCTACHQLLKADGSLQNSPYHSDVVERITDTHFDDPATTDIEGYIVNTTSSHKAGTGVTNMGTCADCHNPHSADNSINNQWGRSAHGGRILDVKDVNAAGAVTETEGVAWVHYDFKLANRLDCQRCHTSTGFKNLANTPTAYSPVNNVFTATANQKEMLYCWACHTSNNGSLRNPGQFVQPPISATNLNTTYVFPAGRDFTVLPATAGSNICINCHSGRETGEYVKALFLTLVVNTPNFGSFNSHYLAAGGILYRTAGYEYAGLDYNNVTYFAHDMIGVNATIAPNTGTNGPCVGCHMGSSEGHSFVPTQRDSVTDLVTAITAQSVCNNCHTGAYPAMTPARLNLLDDEFEGSLVALGNRLMAKGIYYNKAAYPYFFKDNITYTSANAFKNWGSTDGMIGAAFNLNLLTRQPGAYAHNNVYTRRLLFDSIDFVDDMAINNTTAATVCATDFKNNVNQNACAFLNGVR